jgi:hypothetical protein
MNVNHQNDPDGNVVNAASVGPGAAGSAGQLRDRFVVVGRLKCWKRM